MTTSFSKRLTKQVSDILRKRSRIRDGRKVPSPETITLTTGGVRIEGTVLYADLAQSSLLATDFQQSTAAKTIKSFLRCCSRIITKNKGTVTSFDGDRVMGVFQGPGQDSRAALSGLQIHSAVEHIIKPKLTGHFDSMQESHFKIDHCVGIDRGQVLAVRVGHAGSNDIAWIGRAPNLAAKLSDVRSTDYKTIITEAVYTELEAGYQRDSQSMEPIWRKMTYTFLGDKLNVYTSGWYWRP